MAINWGTCLQILTDLVIVLNALFSSTPSMLGLHISYWNTIHTSYIEKSSLWRTFEKVGCVVGLSLTNGAENK